MIKSSGKAQVTSPRQDYPKGSRTHKDRKHASPALSQVASVRFLTFRVVIPHGFAQPLQTGISGSCSSFHLFPAIESATAKSLARPYPLLSSFIGTTAMEWRRRFRPFV